MALRHMACALVLLVPARAVRAQGNGSVLRAVVGDGMNGGRFVPDAEVSVRPGGLHAKTSVLGEARVAGVPAGTYFVDVRRVGYEPLSTIVSLTGHDTVEVSFLIKPAAQVLATVNVPEKLMGPGLPGFNERLLHHTGGYFVTGDVLHAALGSNIADVLSTRVPGIAFGVSIDGTVKVFSLRGPMNIAAGFCQVAVFLDGVHITNGDAGILPISQLGGVEYYSPSFVPPQYKIASSMRTANDGGDGTAACGVLLLWSGM